ncbi:CPBP family intramembrane glutamic endopeptidase [Paraglaciecola sp.]|uniref:CPBP family intramembrane glutamic endopeptidase n=1 Tax=Paraglaciecola sp. TaxID=1920173 RepID=UPI0030F3E572
MYLFLKKKSSSLVLQTKNAGVLCLDLIIYISAMFLIREVYFAQFNFITNGLFWSFSTLLVATGMIRLRGVSWREIGLSWPCNFKKAVLASIFIFVFTLSSIVIFQMFKEHFGLQIAPDKSAEQALSKFGQLTGNWPLFFTIIPFIWLQSTLEEMLDRGFLINWIEQMLANTWFATAVAVIIQAIIFGFRHSYDLSERSITVGLIGLAMGLGYVCFGRNLWPLIFAHCLLNTMSMLDRV